MSHKGSKGRKKHGAHEEEHENHERWLVSYADMLTLLFVLFVVLFSMSSVDQKKFAQLAEGLAQGFGSPSAAFSGKEGAIEGNGQVSAALPLAPGADPGIREAANQSSTVTNKAIRDAVATAERANASANAQAAEREVANLREIQKKIEAALAKEKLAKDVRFTIDERGLVVTVVSSEVVFAGDRADLRPGGRRILHAVGPSLVELPNKIQVDGHTNQLKVPTRAYPTAWELSTARASIVVRALAEEGVSANRLSAAGYAGTRPLIDPKDPRAVTLNRRVDVVVLSSLPAEQRALLPAAAGVQEKNHHTTD
jgi:chemotaxis protein MotB